MCFAARRKKSHRMAALETRLCPVLQEQDSPDGKVFHSILWSSSEKMYRQGQSRLISWIERVFLERKYEKKIKIKSNELVSDVVFDFFQAMSMKFANRIRKPSYERWITVPSTLTVPCVTLNMEVICRNAAILICFLPYPWNVKTSRPSLVITEPSPKHHVSPAIIIKLTCHIILQD